MKRLFVSLSIVLLSGCATQEASKDAYWKIATSGAIGCLPDEIVLPRVEITWGAPFGYWLATCKDKTFVCSYHHNAMVLNCKERLK